MLSNLAVKNFIFVDVTYSNQTSGRSATVKICQRVKELPGKSEGITRSELSVRTVDPAKTEERYDLKSWNCTSTVLLHFFKNVLESWRPLRGGC